MITDVEVSAVDFSSRKITLLFHLKEYLAWEAQDVTPVTPYLYPEEGAVLITGQRCLHMILIAICDRKLV